MESRSIDRSTARYLGEGSGLQFWAARDESGRICVTFVPDRWPNGRFSATGCSSVNQFHTSGAWVASESGRDFAAAIFIPDGYRSAAEEKLSSAAVMDNLVVFDTVDAVESAIATHGDSVRIPAAETAPGKSDLVIPLQALLL